MRHATCTGALALVVAVSAAVVGAHANDETKYPDFSGQWKRPPGLGNQWDISKPGRLGQVPPLTREYRLKWEAGLQDQNAGGQGTDTTWRCTPDGMPRAMNVILPMEIIVTTNTTYVLIEHLTQQRRIFTDGRKFPEEEEFEPSFMGYSVGHWVDDDKDGKFDALEIETRFLKGPRAFDASGIPLHEDGKTVVKERLYLDRQNANLLHDDITTYGNALTQPWTVNKRYVRETRPVIWVEASCPESSNYVTIQGEIYARSADGKLMPVKRGQKAPDLSYFNGE